MAAAMREAEAPIYVALRPLVLRGELSPSEADILGEHVRNLALAEIGAIEYRYTLSEPMASLMARVGSRVTEAAAAGATQAKQDSPGRSTYGRISERFHRM